MDLHGLKVVVLGAGDIGSAVAHRLFRGACAVVIHEDPKPTTTRRGMAFADAVLMGAPAWTGSMPCAPEILPTHRDAWELFGRAARMPVHRN